MMKKMLCITGVMLLMAFSCTQAAKYDADAAVVAEAKSEAERGNARAQSALAACYAVLNYEGIPHDYAKARKWYEKAAAQGIAEAQFNLGLMYAKGQGVRQDLRTAKEWFSKACDNGDQQGCYNYRILNEGI